MTEQVTSSEETAQDVVSFLNAHLQSAIHQSDRILIEFPDPDTMIIRFVHGRPCEFCGCENTHTDDCFLVHWAQDSSVDIEC